MDIKRRRISRWFRFCWKSFEKMHQKKLLAKTWQKYALFKLLHMFIKFVLLITFLVYFLTTFSTDSKSAWNSALFDTFFYLKKKTFLGHISTFFKLWSQTRKKRLKKSKNLFCKCVLDFNFAPIKRSIFFIFKKKSNSLYPIVHPLSHQLRVASIR